VVTRLDTDAQASGIEHTDADTDQYTAANANADTD
jgi:hypothetical protein